MTLINGRVVGINQREFSLRTGSDEESHGGGRLYAVDPAAVAHLKAVLAAQPSPQAAGHKQPAAEADRPFGCRTCSER
ncbi:MAG: hypothetical protein IPJ94_09475 [Chloroflexi bacterium]|nr:hypothetical protein [Chloroflexota bacterium]